MSLNQFRTQVLLLHSEQSALDSLSSGFNDRYTVHCATSGTEALNYLGDTPIHVIISAQDLPGMSGVEALREAKKRSPETIGILLAQDDDDSVEALVGDQEVFEVVRGNVTHEDLLKLIDDATQKMRLVALAESANDTAANADETIAEHIVMETSENGATIISDGTGRLPTLDPKKVSAAAAVGSRSVDVLVLTQDKDFLSTVRDSARGMHNVHFANSLKQADDAIKKNKVGVAVVDAGMVGNKVEKLTLHLRRAAPRLVSIVAGRREDGEMLMDLINRGKVYRFLLKPVSPGRARLAIEASIKHHLEAPDSAFKTVPAETSTAAKGPATKPEIAAVPNATKPSPKPKSAPAKSASPSEAAAELPVDPNLDNAFADGDSGLAETMTGIASSVGKQISDIKDSFGGSRPAENDTDATGGGSPFASPKIIGIGVAAIALVAVGLFWATRSPDEVAPPVTDETAAEAPVTALQPEPVVEEPVAEVVDNASAELLDEARLARDAGQIFNPPGSNAIELYVSAAAADPANAAIAAELDAIIAQALSMAEAALLENRTGEAEAALQRVTLADPGNARLPFLTAQLSQIQLRGYLDDARSAIRDTRFEEAAAAISAARLLDVPDTSPIDTVEQELNAARSDQRTEEVIALANARLEEGQLIAPPDDNARFYFELALSSDPTNAAARQGLAVVASKLVLAARAEIDGGNFDAAASLLSDAQQVDSSSPELGASIAALAAARDRTAQDNARREEESRAAAERERLERERAEAQAQLEAERKAQAERSATLAAAVPVAQQATLEESAGAEPEPQPAAVRAAVDDRPVAVSALKRTKYVAPKYPRSAQRRDISGYVDVVFTVNTAGGVENIVIRGSEPGDVFVNSAINAVEKWEFEPVVVDGVAVDKRAAVRMMFAID